MNKQLIYLREEVVNSFYHNIFNFCYKKDEIFNRHYDSQGKPVKFLEAKKLYENSTFDKYTIYPLIKVSFHKGTCMIKSVSVKFMINRFLLRNMKEQISKRLEDAQIEFIDSFREFINKLIHKKVETQYILNTFTGSYKKCKVSYYHNQEISNYCRDFKERRKKYILDPISFIVGEQEYPWKQERTGLIFHEIKCKCDYIITEGRPKENENGNEQKS